MVSCGTINMLTRGRPDTQQAARRSRVDCPRAIRRGCQGGFETSGAPVGAEQPHHRRAVPLVAAASIIAVVAARLLRLGEDPAAHREGASQLSTGRVCPWLLEEKRQFLRR